MLSFSKSTKYWRLVSLIATYPIHKMKLQKTPKFHWSSLAIKEVIPFKYQAFITLNCCARSYSSPQPKISATWKAAIPTVHPRCGFLFLMAYPYCIKFSGNRICSLPGLAATKLQLNWQTEPILRIWNNPWQSLSSCSTGIATYSLWKCSAYKVQLKVEKKQKILLWLIIRNNLLLRTKQTDV